MKLDGSYGEGGGQILRTAVALSSVTGKAIEIENIRKNRPAPGLKAQHVKAVESVASICQADVKGCSLNSTELHFTPGEIKGGNYNIDIGTAGSIPLLLQCIMPVAISLKEDIKLKVTGGTDVLWSPTIDYLRYVTLGALSIMGYRCDIKIIRRGYYPRGGGCVEAVIHPSGLKAVQFEKNECEKIQGISHSSGLPSHVVERQASSAQKILQQAGYDSRIILESDGYSSTGSGLTLWCGNAGGIALGKPGLRAEKVGSSSSHSIIKELISGAGVDIFLADQIIPYMALAGGGTLTTRMKTTHTLTNIWVTERFLNVKFKIDKLENGLFKISV